MNFTFRGIRKPYIFNVNKKQPVSHEETIELLNIVDRPGAIFLYREVGVRAIPVEVWVSSEEFESLEKLEENLAEWLWSDEPQPLSFDDSTDRSYMAFARIVSKPIAYMYSAKIDLLFLCLDSFKLGPAKSVDIFTGQASIQYPGTVPDAPIIELDILDDVTNIDVMTNDSVFRVGSAEDIDKEPYEAQTLVASYPLTDLIGWTVASEVDNGYVTGNMIATPSGLKAETYGAALSPARFQGPAMRRALPNETTLQDFLMEVRVKLPNSSAQTGMIEIYLKDVLDRTIAKVGIEDIKTAAAEVQAKFQIGEVGSRAVDERRIADKPYVWNDFEGIIRLSRKGKEFKPYFALVGQDGIHGSRATNMYYYDTEGAYQSPIAYVIIAIRKWPATSHVDSVVRDLKFWRYNQPTSGAPIIATAGDKLVIDSSKNLVAVNGEARTDLPAFGFPFPKLQPGFNHVAVQPVDKLMGKIIYRGRYR